MYLKPLSKRHNYAARRDGGRLNTVEEWPTAGAADSVDGLWSYERLDAARSALFSREAPTESNAS